MKQLLFFILSLTLLITTGFTCARNTPDSVRQSDLGYSSNASKLFTRMSGDIRNLDHGLYRYEDMKVVCMFYKDEGTSLLMDCVSKGAQ